MQLNARNITAEKMFDLLAEQQSRKIDVVVKATQLTAQGGWIEVADVPPTISEQGVTTINGLYQPLATFQEHVSEKLNIPLAFLRRMAADRPDIWDDIVNGLLRGDTDDVEEGAEPDYPADPRNFLFRGFQAEDEEADWVARGLLSDKYKIVDNFDAVTATLKGIEEARLTGQVVAKGDISDRHMYLRFIVPAVEIAAQQLLDGYRDPFTGKGADERVGGGWSRDAVRAARAAARVERQGFDPVLTGGFEIRNSELGYGSTAVIPYAEFLVCGNGQTVKADMVPAVHIGGRQEVGAVDWSEDTRKKELATMTAKVRDAVVAFTSADYWQRQVDEWTRKGEKTVDKPEETVGQVTKTLGFTDEERNTVLRHFILGGKLTAGGVMNAVTSTAQTLSSPDRVALFQDSAVKVLDLV
jgi:hypothetical protein